MPEITLRPSLTAKSVENTRATPKLDEEIKDGQCKGLALRLNGGRVYWTIRWMFGDTYKRWMVGDHQVAPDEARRRAWHLKSCCARGMDPSRQVTEWLTGIRMVRQAELAEQRGPKSIPWDSARKLFLDHIFRARRPATYDDYRSVLNTPELARFAGRSVATITDADVAGVLADVAKRSEAHAEHVQRVLASMWTFLAQPANRQATGVVPAAIAHVRAPERTRRERGDPGVSVTEDAPPDRIEIGRSITIARLGVFPPMLSNGVLLIAGSAQRIRPVVSAFKLDFDSFGDEVLWSMAPFFRKTAHKKRSRSSHVVPLIGFAAQAARDLSAAAEGNWLLPVSRSRRAGQQPKTPHIVPRTLAGVLESMPGVAFSSHGYRAALATYGPQDLGWAQNDAKLILDHMEGFDPGDVTAQHYNTDPQIVKKRTMMTAWVGWLEHQAAAAIAADPILRDREAVSEQVYRIRYGDDAWRKAIERKK